MGFTKIYDAEHIAKANARKASRAAKAADWHANQEFSRICWTCKAMYACKNADLIAGPVQATYICPACAATRNIAQFFVALAQFVTEQEADREAKAAAKGETK